MAQYLTYDEYTEYGGQLDEASYAVAEFKARSRLDWLTLGRIQHMKTIPEEVKLAMLSIIKVDSKFSATAQADSAIVSSFSTDGYSESYGGASEQSAAAENKVNTEVVKMLFGVLDDFGEPLIYRGLA